ncbi:hypothetical protein JG688_00006953, partial [Phytophthora aleatoria]
LYHDRRTLPQRNGGQDSFLHGYRTHPSLGCVLRLLKRSPSQEIGPAEEPRCRRRVLLCSGMRRSAARVINILRSAGVDVRVSSKSYDGRTLYCKAMLLDDRIMIGSANLSQNAMERNIEDIWLLLGVIGAFYFCLLLHLT